MIWAEEVFLNSQQLSSHFPAGFVLLSGLSGIPPGGTLGQWPCVGRAVWCVAPVGSTN